MNTKVSLTTQNRLIITGLILSTVLIIGIAIFAIINIQQKLNRGYQSFGEVLSKTLAIESVEIIKDLPQNEIYSTLKKHTDAILREHNDISMIEFRDKDGQIIYSGRNSNETKPQKALIIVSSPLKSGGDVIGSVKIGLSGNFISAISSTTRASLLFVFSIAWIVFAFVILINTYLITRELRILHEGVHKISTGEFGFTITGKEVSSEVQELFDAFNNMSNRLHIYEEQNIEQLTLERNKLEAILMSIANGVVVCDNFDNVVLVNNHAQHLLEIGEHFDTKIQDYIDTSGNFCFKDKIEEFKDTPLAQMENQPLEFNISVDNRVIKSIISPMFTRNKDYVGYIIVLIDMTKEAEMEQMRSHFISNVSHELRTPVTVLRSYIDTLYNYGNDFDETTKRDFVGTINTEIIRLNTMVNDILDFSRLDSNVALEKTLNNIAEVIEGAVRQVKVLAKEHNITISVSKEGEMPDVLFNYNAIERAFLNIISNAIKYSPDNSTVWVKVTHLQDEIEVSVRDEGCGIPQEHLTKIFDRFYRVENNIHTIKGTGLGLHLVKTAIEKHHMGKVFVESEDGQGSTFGFRLPVAILDKSENVSIS